MCTSKFHFTPFNSSPKISAPGRLRHQEPALAEVRFQLGRSEPILDMITEQGLSKNPNIPFLVYIYNIYIYMLYVYIGLYNLSSLSSCSLFRNKNVAYAIMCSILRPTWESKSCFFFKRRFCAAVLAISCSLLIVNCLWEKMQLNSRQWPDGILPQILMAKAWLCAVSFWKSTHTKHVFYCSL